MPNVLEPGLRVAKLPRDKILFSSVQSQGKAPRQEDVVAHFSDECFVVCDGVSGIPHGDEAARTAADTAIWAYKAVRQRQIYWLEKRLLIKRIFRSTNLRIWQKKREEGFEDGLATTMLVAVIGPRGIWVGSVGDTAAFVFHNGQLLRLTILDRDAEGKLTRALGFQRLGLLPNSAHPQLFAGDMVVLATDGITDTLSAKVLTEIAGSVGDTQKDIDEAAAAILAKAHASEGRQNMTVCLIKRIALPR